MSWFGGNDTPKRPTATTVNGKPVTGTTPPTTTGAPTGERPHVTLINGKPINTPAGLAELAKIKADREAAENPAPTPPTDPAASGISAVTAGMAAERQRKRAAGGSTLTPSSSSGTAARALLTPRTLVGGS